MERTNAAPPLDPNSDRWRALAVLTVAELLGMSPWFAFNAVTPQLRAAWSLSAAQVGWLNAAVQLGFVFGTAAAAFFNLADVLPARGYFATSALGAALANISLLFAHGVTAAAAARFMTGVFLAGVYPPGMKMAATWFQKERGLAIGVLVGGLAIGKGIPYLIHAWPSRTCAPYSRSPHSPPCLGRAGAGGLSRRAVSVSATGVLLAPRRSGLALAPSHARDRRLPRPHVGAVRDVGVGARLSRRQLRRARPGQPLRAHAPDLVSFGVLIAGGVGCVWGGWAAARNGYERVVIVVDVREWRVRASAPAWRSAARPRWWRLWCGCGDSSWCRTARSSARW